MKRAALIGLGMVADTHVAALRDSKVAELVGVLGRDPKKSAAFAARVGQDVECYQDIHGLVADPKVDFVILATPPDARLDYVQTVANAGLPILAEKPLERSLAQATAIVWLCEDCKVPLGVVFQHRQRSASIALKEAIAQGCLGTVVSAEIRVPWWRDQSYYDVPGRGSRVRDGGGVLITQAIHTLDLALWLLGPFKRVQALLSKTILHRMECEDWAGAIFETRDGCVGSLTATTTAFPGGSETITLNGTEASAHLEAGVLTLHHRSGEIETVGVEASTGGGSDPMAFTHTWHQSVLDGFVAELTGDAPDISCASGRDALMSHAVIDAMERSSQSGTWQEIEVQ